ESSRISREKNKAEEVYFREAEDWDGAKPPVLFRRISRAEFLPADEITEMQYRKHGVLKFRFRDHWCWATPAAKERHEELRLPAQEEIERWLEEAGQARA